MPIKGALYAVRCRHHHCHCHCHCHWRAALTRRPLGRFDQDGTLLDTETLATEAIRAVIAPYGGMLRRAPLTCPRPVCRDVRVEPQAAPPRAADACVDRHRRRGPRARREAQRRGARRAVGGVPERQGVSCGLARTRTDSRPAQVPQRLPGALEVVRLLRASGLKEALCTSAPRAVTAFRGEHERELFGIAARRTRRPSPPPQRTSTRS